MKRINYLLMLSSILLFVVGLFGILRYEIILSRYNELQQTIENQNKLIKILEVSCECECDE